jgi:glycosyltransferase involved in cell wall biosynthesis
MLNGEAKWGALYGCEAFVLPSHQENFGIAVVEALACGRPVLISDQVNIWREIVEGGAGLVAEDTLEGTYTLLASLVEKSSIQKQLLTSQAEKVYQDCFNITYFTNNFLRALTST